MDPDTRGWLSGAAASLLVGASFPVSAALDAYPAALGQAGRYAVGALILTAVLRGRLGRPDAREIALLAALAVTGMAGFNLLLLAAVERIGAPATGVLVGASPLALALVVPALAGARPQGRLVAAATAVVAGVALVAGSAPSTEVAGTALALGALACEVLFTLLAAPLLPRLGPVRVAAWAAWIAAGGLAAVAAATETPAWPSAPELAALLQLAVATTALAFVLWFRAVQALGPARAGLLIGLMPVAAVAFDWPLNGNPPAPLELAGAALVTLGDVAGQLAPASATVRG